jgi:hypothetical protein
MIRIPKAWIGASLALAAACSLSGCASCHNSCDPCGNSCNTGCGGCGTGCGFWGSCCLNPHTWRHPAIPETLPLGSTVRAHYHTMEANGEASDFIIHDHEFAGNTAELTPSGRDHIAEVGARMRSTPFPVLIERSENNSDPELDAHRRQIVAQVLYSMGNPDADQRTIVAQAYGKGLNSQEAEFDYYNFLYTRGGFGGGGFNNQGNFGGFGVGGGGGAGGIGFGR